MGRVDERWRFRAEDAVSARARASQPDVLDMDLVSLEKSPSFREATLEKPWTDRLLDEVPAAAVAHSSWKLCVIGPLEGH